MYIEINLLSLPETVPEDILVLFHTAVYVEGSFLEAGFDTFPNFSEKQHLLPISEKTLLTSFRYLFSNMLITTEYTEF